MARDLAAVQADEDGLFELSIMTGTLRYMAPEVVLGKRYNEGCDVYSFTLLVWEMLALARPYESIRRQDTFIELVSGGGGKVRPPLRKDWSQTCKDLFQGGWHEDPLARSKICVIKNLLRIELAARRGVSEEEYDDDFCRRRSTFVYQSSRKCKS
jgi:serine/threonine protein kinase